MSRRPTVLITRPRRESQALADELAAQGWAPLIWPVIDIHPLTDAPDIAKFQAVLLSSANAARLARPAAIPAFCVGPRTAQAAREAGFETVFDAEGDAAALAALAAARLDRGAGPLIHLRGRDAAGDLAGALGASGFTVETAILYEARPTGPAPAAIARALEAGAVDLALFYSPRSAALFARGIESLRPALASARALAISPAAAKPLHNCGFMTLETARTPNGAAMRDAIERIGRLALGCAGPPQ